MRTARIWLMFALLLSSLSALQGAKADTTAARKAIQAAYDKQNAAAKKDVDGMLVIETPDYVSIDSKGHKRDMENRRERYEQMAAMAQSIQGKSVVQNIQVKGARAEVVVKERAVVVLMNPQTQQTATLVVDTSARDSWVKTRKGWMKKVSRDLTAKSTLNGQPLPDNPGDNGPPPS